MCRLTKVCEMLADPYGADDADLAVKHYVTFTLNMSKHILKLSRNMSRDKESAIEEAKEMEQQEKMLEIKGAFGCLQRVLEHKARRKGSDFKNRVERALHIDLDGDGDIGDSGHRSLDAQRSPLVARGATRARRLQP